MSAQGALPSAAAPPRLRLALLIATIAMAPAACSRGPEDYVVLSKTAPDTHHVAAVRLTKCDAGWCEGLWMGQTTESLELIATLRGANERCSEIAWSRDGKRAGFLINGQQLRIYGTDTHRPAGQIDLVPRDSDPPTRLARGLTFSENGAAITFDDCPRDRSGCRPALVALR